MTDLAHHRELCGCLLNADGRCIQPCAECLRVALQERTNGIKPPTLWDRYIKWLTD